MIPSTTRASYAYSNDGCTVTAWARLTLQSFPTNKTLNTEPLAPLLSEYCNEVDISSGGKIALRVIFAFHPYVQIRLSFRLHREDNMESGVTCSILQKVVCFLYTVGLHTEETVLGIGHKKALFNPVS